MISYVVVRDMTLSLRFLKPFMIPPMTMYKVIRSISSATYTNTQMPRIALGVHGCVSNIPLGLKAQVFSYDIYKP